MIEGKYLHTRLLRRIRGSDFNDRGKIYTYKVTQTYKGSDFNDNLKLISNDDFKVEICLIILY